MTNKGKNEKSLDNTKGLYVSRRSFLIHSTSLALASLAGFSISQPAIRKTILDKASGFNDHIQGVIFSPHRLAPTFQHKDITSPFPSNLFYPLAYAPDVLSNDWSLSLSGRIKRNTPVSLQELRNMPQESQITRLICIEGWSAIGHWSGVPLRYLLREIGADIHNTVLRVDCADGYYTSIDMASAMHPQTILALDFLGQPLSREYGAPVRLRIPTKLGFKNAKYITGISIHSEDKKSGYWEEQGYNWFSGL